ncbi:hypothetical protein ACUTF1_32995, partial [Burkholderia pseudomallei]
RARGGNRTLPLARRAAGFYRCEAGRGEMCSRTARFIPAFVRVPDSRVLDPSAALHARFARLGDERLDRTARNETGNRAAIAAVSSASRAPRGRRDCCKPSTGRTADYQRMRNGRL